MSPKSNAHRLCEAGILAKNFLDIADFVESINKLSEEEVDALIEISNKVESFKLEPDAIPQWC